MIKKILIGIISTLFLIQFIPDRRTNPKVEEEIVVSSEIKTVLKQSCYDCHSNNTVWPWYSGIAPLSWYMTGHVNEGRSKMNFSTWNKYDAKKRAHLLEEVMENVEENEMPLESYLTLHPDAVLSDEDIKVIKSFTAE